MTQEHIEWMKSYFKEVRTSPTLESFLQPELKEVSEGKVVYEFVIHEKHSNIYGFVHGGTLASISDIAMGTSCITYGKRIVTIDMGISYIKNTVAGSTLTAIGKVINNGKSIMRTECEIYEGDQLLVKSHASYYVTGDFCSDDYPHPNE